MTSADSGRTSLQLNGPEGLNSFWNSTNNFTYRSQLNISIHEIKKIQRIEYEKIVIYCLPIGGNRRNINQEEVEEEDQNEEEERNIEGKGVHICYIIETKVLPGKFDIKKAKELGVPIGPLCKQLQSGNSIILQDGRVITPELVVGPSEKSRFAAIICNCSNHYQNTSSDNLVNEIISHPFWSR